MQVMNVLQAFPLKLPKNSRKNGIWVGEDAPVLLRRKIRT